jgi:hypothetical protein
MVFQGRWLCRTVRGARPDHNPLRRGTDRLEAYLLGGMIATAAVVTPFAAQAAGHVSYENALQMRQEQLAARHAERAVLTEGAGLINGYTLSTEVPAEATWTAASGARRSGEVPAPAGSPAGAAVTVWTNRSGYLVSPPLDYSEVASQADAAMVGAIAGVGVAAAAAAVAIRQVLNRRRMAAWDADWLVTAQAWNRRSWQ